MAMKSNRKHKKEKDVSRSCVLSSWKGALFFLSLAVSRIGIVWATHQSNKHPFSNDIPDPKLVYKIVVVSRTFQTMQRVNEGNLPQFVTPLYFSNDKGSGVELLVATYAREEAILVLFRGTDELRDWNENFSVSRSHLGPEGRKIMSAGMVHKGFNQVFNGGVVDDVASIIHELLKKQSYRLIFAGYSKGAAEALLAASFVAKTYFPKNDFTVIGFASPRVGDNGYYQWVNALDNLSVWNFVRQDDPVCRLPPESWGYESIGHLVQLDEDGAKAYYRHYGDQTLGLLGAPSGWDNDISADFRIHFLSEYEFYLKKSKKNPEVYYVDGFEEENYSQGDNTGEEEQGDDKNDCEKMSWFKRFMLGRFLC